MNKTKLVHAKVAPPLKIAVDNAAKREALTTSEWMRSILIDALKERQLWPPPGPTGAAPAGGGKC